MKHLGHRIGNKPRHRQLLRLVQKDPNRSASQLAELTGMNRQTVIMSLHRMGYFKVWAKIQMPTSEGTKIESTYERKVPECRPVC